MSCVTVVMCDTLGDYSDMAFLNKLIEKLVEICYSKCICCHALTNCITLYAFCYQRLKYNVYVYVYVCVCTVYCIWVVDKYIIHVSYGVTYSSKQFENFSNFGCHTIWYICQLYTLVKSYHAFVL